MTPLSPSPGSARGSVPQLDIKAGNEFMRGLSGGNKRRLSIAVALTKQPLVLFLDEPTSGVDSASAVMIMSFLKHVAKERDIAIVCTIHQPPASVFAGFDNALILSMGRIAYFGKAAQMGEYFASIGNAPLADTNLAEFVLDLVNKDFTSAASVEQILDTWEARGGQPYYNSDGDGAPEPKAEGSAEPPKLKGRAGFCRQLGVLTRRTVKVAAREPLSYLARAVANLFATTFFSIIYLETRNKRQDQVQPRTFFVMFAMGIPMQFILVSVYAYYQQWVSLKKEVKDGMYNPVASAIASWVVQVPMMFVLALCSLLPIFIIGDMHWPNFPMAWLVYALTFWSFEGCAQMLAVSPRVIFGLFNYLNLYFAAFLFCGMFVDVSDVVWPLRTMCYFFPLGWALQSYIYALYHGQPDYSGALDCTPGAVMPNGVLCSDQGFYCSSDDDPTGAVCYGRTGDQILNSLSIQFTIFGDDGHYARNIGLIIAFGALCRIGYVAQVWVLTQVVGGQEPADPAAATVSSTTDDSNPADTPSSRTSPSIAPGVEPAAEVTAAAKPESDESRLSFGSQDAGPCVFSFSEIGYTITPKTLTGKKLPPKVVLSGATATVSDGEVLAIVGPSGAGKTILLNTLNFAKGPGVPHGTITLNNVPLTQTQHVKACIYVPREDILWPTLTARQHLDTAYRLYQPTLDAAARATAVDDLLAATGMTSAQHTKAGGLLFQGLSGGQRRRLSLGIALIKQPRVIILDEPTSGLDSAAAAAIVELLKSIAVKCRAAIVCTIHQPSAAVFSGFNQVLVLSEGRVAFCGGRDAMSSHFAQIGKPLAKGANPAEAVLDLISKDITSKAEVTACLDGWDAAAAAAHAPPKADVGAITLGVPNLGAFGATFIVLRRQFFLAFNDPLQYLARMVVCPFVCCFFGLVYQAAREHVQVQVPFRLFYLWWILAIPPCLCIISIITMTNEMKAVVYEIKNGMYRPFAYALSTTVVQVPMLILLSFAINVCVFAVGNWPWDNFATFVLQYACNLFVFEALTQLLSTLFANPILGMLAFLMFWSSSIIFCGLVFRGNDVIWPFRTFYYTLPLRWLFNSVGYDIYTPATYDGAYDCVPGTNVTTDQGNATCAETGFYCTDASTSLGCYGRTGSQVLSTLHLTYESLDSADDRLMDFIIMLSMGLGFKLQFAIFLMRAVSVSDSPKAAPANGTPAITGTQAA